MSLPLAKSQREQRIFAAIAAGGSGTGDTSWTNATLLNGWTNYGSDGGGTYSTTGYRKDGQGFVHLRGFIVAGTTTSGVQIFTLPAGYRPGQNSIHTAFSGTSASIRANVYSGSSPSTGSGATATGPGTVNLVTVNTIVAGQFVSLDGITFLAET